MSQDLQRYAHIIEKLKPLAREPEFNQALLKIAKDLPREKQFLIKMEIKRLARPCLRSVDLRGQVDGECRLHEYEGIQHYLDDVAIEEFEKQIRIFGRYCFGVYEAMLRTENNFKVMRDRQDSQADVEEDRQQQSLIKFDVPEVSLLRYIQRGEERMNFAIALEVFTKNGTSVRATSVDISSHGVRMKLVNSNYDFTKDEKVSVHFRGLESEFSLDKHTGIAYIVLKVVEERDKTYVMLKRNEDMPNGEFDHFLENFIHGNKRRYKVNLNNTIDAIINKTCEQYFSPSFPTLPIFVDWIDDGPIPRFAMANEINRSVISYWSDEEENIRLGYLVNRARLSYLIGEYRKGQEAAMYVYAFNHLQKGKVYFYSASNIDLKKNDALRTLFLGFGAKKVSWRVFKITIAEIDPEDAYAPLSLPDSVGNKIKRQNTPPAPRLMAKLKNLKYVAQVTDITSEYGQQVYYHFKVNKQELKQLRLFGHPRNRLPAEIKAFKYKFHDQRMEARYLLRSVVRVEILDDLIMGVSEDISVSGLRLELEGEYHGDLDVRVIIGFPRLQEITKKHNVMNLHYKVVNVSEDGKILHLRAVSGDEGRSARAFFDELIKKNRNHLETYPDEEEIPGIGHALRCINARNIPTLSFILSKEGARYHPQVAAISPNENRIKRLLTTFASEQKINLESFFRDRNHDSQQIQQSIKQIKVEHQPLHHELYLAFNPTKRDPRLAITPRYSNTFRTHEARLQFIREAIQQGQFIALSVHLSTTTKPDLDMLQAEINYISVYALHRAKELEEKLWAIGACVHAVDITEEVLSRYNIPNDIIEANQTQFKDK